MDVVNIQSIKWKGVLDWEGLYKVMFQWFMRYKYIFTENTLKSAWGPFGQEFEIEWDAWRKVTNYVKYVVEIYVHAWDKRDVEVVKDGKKKTMQHIRFNMEFNVRIETDYQGKLSGTPFKDKLRNFYEKYIIRKDLAFDHWDPLYYQISGLREVIKKFLDSQVQGVR
ncbi:hypothetical protein ACFL1H_07055 [Nanoarchaeota archaeon]